MGYSQQVYWSGLPFPPPVDEIVGLYYQFNGHELGQTPGDGEGQGGLGCCSPWGRKVLTDMTSRLNKNSLKCFIQLSSKCLICSQMSATLL